MPYTLQDYHNYSKYIPSFFKNLTSVSEIFQQYEIRDILDEDNIPDIASATAVGSVWIWSHREKYPSIGRRCFLNSQAHRIVDEKIPTEIGERVDRWLQDVRVRKEEFEAFMRSVATNYTPLSVAEIHRMARTE